MEIWGQFPQLDFWGFVLPLCNLYPFPFRCRVILNHVEVYKTLGKVKIIDLQTVVKTTYLFAAFRLIKKKKVLKNYLKTEDQAKAQKQRKYPLPHQTLKKSSWLSLAKLKEIQRSLNISLTSVFASLILLPFAATTLLELEETTPQPNSFVLPQNHLPNEVFHGLFEDLSIQNQNSSMKNEVLCGITLSLRLGIKVSQKHDESQWF